MISIRYSFINENSDGTAKALLAGCYKFGAATLLRGGQASMTSVLIEYDYE